ncbi:hypothetical protein G6F57_012016 [Rhizopus arrhizus]|uniref:Serine aminopeptidase S33 domain-containing protein n=1 Tax=Rhizopus oryzae TaxID=64495 RepID=A0A9P6X7M6_RHIOR|nr:hypothetical protein G6F23_012513 [Rhizopus arrhizus]KAG1402877.1 hypothetical protein G6F58_010488 [Rhizopus delemar]KAG0774164.1 hypothetical protein G6F22_014285 [Rhizopus arrhizus]KAG0782308.1 hypothetical protein G6F21_011183 [Rhizopus arrhizus]KAG0818180.1 hypothetical protein G6F20_001782 [Rhizopus arrhizus]
MSKVTVVDEWIKTEDGNDIFTKTWKAISTPIATLVLIHGFGEHVARYDRMCSYFASQGIECYAYDQRGWGETALEDVNNAVIKMKRENIPLFLMGHSMGGGVILNYLSRSDKYKGVKLIDGSIASSPLVTLSMPIPAPKYYGLRMISNLLPNFTIQAGVDPNGISHDPEEVNKFRQDPLVHDYATLNTLKSMIDAGSDILKSRAKLIECPILYSHGDADPINSHTSCVKACELTRSKDKEMKSWAGLYHELHNETLSERQQILNYYLDWIKNRCPAIKQ